MYRTHAIDPGLAAACAWVDEFWSYVGQGRPHRVLPDGCMDFVFELGSGRVRVIGAMSCAELVCVGQRERLFGVRFRPGRAALLLPVAAHELADCDVAAQELLGASARHLADAVCGAADDRAREHAVAAFIADPASRCAAPDGRLERALLALQRSAGAVPIAQVARCAQLGERQLERVFRQRIGLRPKLLARILRMQRTLRLAAAAPGSQAQLSADAGYADEPHLVREFQALCGASPAQIRRERDVGFVQASARSFEPDCPP